MSDHDQQDVARISEFVHSLNRAWVAGRWEELAEFFHEDVVLEFPGFSGQTEGRTAMVDGFTPLRSAPQFSA